MNSFTRTAMKKKISSWTCSFCEFKNYYNKTVCYNCAKRRNYSKAPEQKAVW